MGAWRGAAPGFVQERPVAALQLQQPATLRAAGNMNPGHGPAAALRLEGSVQKLRLESRSLVSARHAH
jgi:hypothetical protein